MKKIRLKRNLAGPNLPRGGHFEGEVVSVPGDVPEDVARDLLARGWAEEVRDGD